MASTSPRQRQGILGRLFGDVAFWQVMAFLALIAFVWARETVDLPALLFGKNKTDVDWIDASLLTAGILVIAIITIGHTYLQQQRILRGFLRVCSYCRRVHVENTEWEPIETYVSARTLAEFTHGICPDCMKRLKAELESLERPEPPEAGDPPTAGS